MRILFTSKKRGWSGETAHILDLVQGCLAAGHQVTLGARSDSQLCQRLRGSGVEMLSLNLLHEMTAPLALWKDLRRLRAVLGRVDLVHTHASWDTWLVAAARQLGRRHVPMVRTRHNLKPIRAHALNRWLYGSALTALVAPSKTIVEDLQRYGFLRRAALFEIRHGVDPAVFDPALYDRPLERRQLREQLGAPEDALVVAYISRLSPVKEPEVLLSAAEDILKSRPDVWFFFAGPLMGSSQFQGDVRRRFRELAPRVQYLGFQERVPALLAASDVFVLPASRESFGLAVAEAMAMQCPPLVAASGGVWECVVEGETGLGFQPGDASDCGRRLRELLDQAGLRQRLGECGRRHVRKHLTRQRMIEEYLATYASLAGHRGP